MKKYYFIQSWGALLGSMSGFVKSQVRQAEADNAPDNAIFKKDGIWHTADGIANPDTLERVKSEAERLEKQDEVNSGRAYRRGTTINYPLYVNAEMLMLEFFVNELVGIRPESCTEEGRGVVTISAHVDIIAQLVTYINDNIISDLRRVNFRVKTIKCRGDAE